MNITSISQIGHVTITIDKPVMVPSNFTGLDKTYLDVWYVPNSADPVALAQNFTFNLTDFSKQQISIDLFFSDPFYVSVDSSLLDEIVVRCYKTFFASPIVKEVEGDALRDMRWDYNDTEPREHYIEMRKTLPPQLGSEVEAQVLEVVNAALTVSLVTSFVLPMALQVVIKTAMNKMWSVFNTLQLLTLVPLMAIKFPGNVKMVFDQIESIISL